VPDRAYPEEGIVVITMTRLVVVVGCLVLVAAAAHAQVVRQVSDARGGNFGAFAIDDAGSVVFTTSTADQFGTNPEHSIQLIKWIYPGPVGSQVGSFARGVATSSVSVTDDGTKVVFISPSDPLGQNHDGSLELFSMMADGSGLVQLTDDPVRNAGSVHAAAISGSGNRVVFVANTDPLGTNPDHLDQLFVIETATLDVTQLTTATSGEFGKLTIDDTGKNVVFAHDGDLTGDNPDGRFEVFMMNIASQVLTQLTDSPTVNSTDPVISGNGGWIAFDAGDIFVMNPGGTPTMLAADGNAPSITDDGAFIYYWAEESGGLPPYSYEIRVIPTSGGPATLLTSAADEVWNLAPIVSGGNTRVVFSSYWGEYPGGNNPDGGPELTTMDVDGSNIEQLTVNEPLPGALYEADIAHDGSRVVFIRGNDIFRAQADGSDLVQVIAGAGALNMSVSGDGSTIVFLSYQNLTGQNPDIDGQIFKIQDDGTGLLQLTPGDCEAAEPHVIAGDGSVVVFQAACDLTPTGWGELFSVPAGGGPFGQITDDDDGLVKFPRVSHNGEWVVYHSATDGSTEVFRARVDGTLVEQLTADALYTSWRPDISADGQRVAYASNADPLGTNPDHNSEIFVYDAGTTTTVQLTITSSGVSGSSRISGDGEYVYFLSTAPFFEESPGELEDIYRVAVDTGIVERAGGFRDPRTRLWRVATAGDGSLAIFEGIANPVDLNPDLSAEVWLVDFAIPATIHVSRTTPTLVTWDVEPNALRCDVIRGDVADLQPGPSNTVDLGPVVCLEDDSPDATTLGFEDPDDPAPGQAFFFLYRGSQGVDDGPGSWGQGTGDAERAAGAGSCVP
jgi:Tol biopolymer transport system component